MYSAEYNGINSFLIGSCQLMEKYAKKRETRGYQCYELPGPYMFKIKNPCCRTVSILERKWNSTLPYAESLWMASGRNDMHFISHYLKRLNDYSDDGITMRGGYGPRFRHYNGSTDDYVSKDFIPESSIEVDQFRYIADCFKADPNTRRAIITIGDPMKDCFNSERRLKETKDIPCTRQLQFIKQADSNKLDMIVTMRSNDLIYGASAVNIFNFTFIQEYFSSILGFEIGEYIHIANNFHYYEGFKTMVQQISKIDLNTIKDEDQEYPKTFTSLEQFDKLLYTLNVEESKMREQGPKYTPVKINDPFFQNWYNKLLKFNLKFYK